MSLSRDGLIVSLALAVAAALYLFAFRDLAVSGSPAAFRPPAVLLAGAAG
jgi:hypothetical protein